MGNGGEMGVGSGNQLRSVLMRSKKVAEFTPTGMYSASQKSADAQWESDTTIAGSTISDAWVVTSDCHLAVAQDSVLKIVTGTVTFSKLLLAAGGTRYKIDLAGKVGLTDMDYVSPATNLPQGQTDTTTATASTVVALGWQDLTLFNGITFRANMENYRVQCTSDLGGSAAIVITSPFPLKIFGT